MPDLSDKHATAARHANGLGISEEFYTILSEQGTFRADGFFQANDGTLYRVVSYAGNAAALEELDSLHAK